MSWALRSNALCVETILHLYQVDPVTRTSEPGREMRVKEDGQNAPQGRKVFWTAWDIAGDTPWLDCF